MTSASQNKNPNGTKCKKSAFVYIFTLNYFHTTFQLVFHHKNCFYADLNFSSPCVLYGDPTCDYYTLIKALVNHVSFQNALECLCLSSPVFLDMSVKLVQLLSNPQWTNGFFIIGSKEPFMIDHLWEWGLSCGQQLLCCSSPNCLGWQIRIPLVLNQWAGLET